MPTHTRRSGVTYEKENARTPAREQSTIRYLLAPELSEEGRWHIHGVLGGIDGHLLSEITDKESVKPCYMHNRPRTPFRCYNIPLLSKGFGYLLAEEIVPNSGPDGLGYLVSYLCKKIYVDKYPHTNYKHRISTSRGLLRPKPIYTGQVSETEYVQLRKMAQAIQGGSVYQTLLLARQDVESFFNANSTCEKCSYGA